MRAVGIILAGVVMHQIKELSRKQAISTMPVEEVIEQLILH